MVVKDDFTKYHEELLEGHYDCVDRIVLNGYFPLGQQGGGFRHWWRRLTGSDETLTQEHLQRMAGHFSRRVHGFAKKSNIPIIHCAPGVRKHEIAQKHLPNDPKFRGLFLILVAKAPALVWQVKTYENGIPHLERKTPWPYVNHYHFHFVDNEWGHVTIKMSGHPPFGVQAILNGHEWVERQALKQTISSVKEGNCFVGGSNFQALSQIADTLCAEHTIGRLAKVCDRWVYSSCLCFALSLHEQEISGFHYQYSCYQLEYGRNLLFARGRMLDEVFQGLIDRTRRTLDVNKLKTILGRKNRPAYRSRNSSTPPRFQRVIEESAFDLTVFKVHFGNVTLKIYDKGERVLRTETIVHNVKDLRTGKLLEKLPIMLDKLRKMTIDFLNVVCAAHINYLDENTFDHLHEPSQTGARRLAGVDLQKHRIRIVTECILALSPSPGGFTTSQLAQKLRQLTGDHGHPYTHRQAAYDLNKFRGKALVERVENTRRYRCTSHGIRTLAAILILRNKVIKPVLAGTARKKRGPRPKNMHPVDLHYENLQTEMLRTFETLGLAA